MPPISSSNTTSDSTISKFTKILPLSIRKDGSLASFSAVSDSSASGGGRRSSSPHRPQGESKENVRVTLTYPSPACGAMNPHKDITLRLTNDENPGFFYHLKITEADFPELKSQQGLLVDFYGFPNQLVTLLERCDGNYGGEDGSSFGGGGGAKFVMVMKIGSHAIVLDIVESNPFKYLCHLSLHINAGTDGEVKKYLCDVTSGLKKDYELLRDKYNHLMSSMESESARMKEQMDVKNGEIGHLRDQLHAQANSLSTKHFQDMTQEKEKLLKLQSELAAKFEYERSEMERRHSITNSTVEERISCLETENRDLLQSKYKSETALQDAANKIKHFEDDLKLLQQEITLLRKQNDKLDHDYHEKQSLSTNLHNRVTNLESELREKQITLEKNHEQIMQLSETKKTLEDHATAMVNEVERVKNVNKMVSAELIKANEIIKKLQDDIRTLNSKTKLQTQVTTEQERVITDRDKAINDLEATISSLTASLSTAKADVDKLTKSEQDADVKIQELEKTITSNENMISWLNKQLNEFQGLSNLSKFRQNLAMSANSQLGQHQNNPSPIAHSTSTGPTMSNNNEPAHSKMYSATNNEGSGGRRFGAAFSASNQSQNTLLNGTPSWMHIYQSTSTPLDDDLSSRLEKVATNPGLGMNYNDLKSRFADPYETELMNKDGKKETDDATTKPTKNHPSRTPTWARGRGGRVTLDLTAGKAGALRR